MNLNFIWSTKFYVRNVIIKLLFHCFSIHLIIFLIPTIMHTHLFVFLSLSVSLHAFSKNVRSRVGKYIFAPV